MTLDRELSNLSVALERDRAAFVPKPLVAASILLNALAGILEASVPAGTPLGRVLELVLRALPASPPAAKDIRRLAEQAGRCEGPHLRATTAQAARALRKLAEGLADLQYQTAQTSEISLQSFAEKYLSRRRRELVLFLLEQEEHAAPERDVIARLWPPEGRRKAPSPAARNRLHKLVFDTNAALMELDESGAYQISRGEGALQLGKAVEAE
jgi:hypothetical protein